MLDFFKDKHGTYVIGQWPNKPLILALGLYVLRYFPNSTAQQFSHWGVAIVLIYWSFLEITSGVNRWRRFLGIIVMFSSSINLLELIASLIITL